MPTKHQRPTCTWDYFGGHLLKAETSMNGSCACKIQGNGITISSRKTGITFSRNLPSLLVFRRRMRNGPKPASFPALMQILYCELLSRPVKVYCSSLESTLTFVPRTHSFSATDLLRTTCRICLMTSSKCVVTPLRASHGTSCQLTVIVELLKSPGGPRAGVPDGPTRERRWDCSTNTKHTQSLEQGSSSVAFCAGAASG